MPDGRTGNQAGARSPAWFSLVLAAMLAFILTGCGEPVPAAKLSYVGVWRGKDMELSLTTEGRVEYWRKKGTGHSKISAPIQRWEGDDFFVGIGPFSTRFKVNKPPSDKDGVWTMTVDDVELTRAGPGAQWTRFRDAARVAGELPQAHPGLPSV